MRPAGRCILLVEDDRVDAMAVQRALHDLHALNPLVHVENGEAALAYLRDPASDRPCLILLDLNMPVMGGIELLEALQADVRLPRYPAVVLTTSEEQQDRIQSFDLGVAGYMRKPVDYRQFVEVVRSIDAYWTLSELPD